MDQVLLGHLRDHVFVYIDDLLVVSEGLDTHFKRLGEMKDALKNANLTINVEKSKFLIKSIRYLGHIVGGGCIRADPDRVKAITEYPVPKTVRQVRSFLGMAGWYQRYLVNFSSVASPITDQLKGKGKFAWTACAQAAAQGTIINRASVNAPGFYVPFRNPMRCIDHLCGRCTLSTRR